MIAESYLDKFYNDTVSLPTTHMHTHTLKPFIITLEYLMLGLIVCKVYIIKSEQTLNVNNLC
jgi:hypothetical protein